MKNAVDTYQSFLGMFDMENLPEKARHMIYSAATVMITKANKPKETYLKRIGKLCKDIEKSETNMPNRKYIIELLKHVYQNQKVTLFE